MSALQVPTILVVDDHELVRMTIGQSLRRRGFVVLEAADAFEATMVCERRRVDVLVTDIVLPGRNGFELARMLMPTHPAMRVVFISGDDRYASEDVLVKPFTAAVLEKVVRGALRA